MSNDGGCPATSLRSIIWLCWNVRGLRNQRTVHELASLMRAQDLAVVFLAETWVDEDRLTKLCNDLHFDEKWVVPRITRANGLALLWKNLVQIDVDSSSLNYFDIIVNKGKDDSWRFTSIYDMPEAGRKHETWDLL